MPPRSLALLTSSFASFGCSGHVDPKLFPNIQFCSPKSWKHHKGSQRIQENPAESQRVSDNPRVSIIRGYRRSCWLFSINLCTDLGKRFYWIVLQDVNFCTSPVLGCLPALCKQQCLQKCRPRALQTNNATARKNNCAAAFGFVSVLILEFWPALLKIQPNFFVTKMNGCSTHDGRSKVWLGGVAASSYF